MDELSFKSTTKCHICDQLFTDEIVKERDHCHVSGKFRGASCQSCNLNFKHPRFIPIICHGLTNFDSHIICSAIGLFKKENISCIAKSTEKYISFSLCDFRFIDSYQCLSVPHCLNVKFIANALGLFIIIVWNVRFGETIVELFMSRKYSLVKLVKRIHIIIKI
jgi:hypothetical protein